MVLIPTPELVKLARQNAGLTQKEAAERFGYSLRAWQRKEEAGETGRSLSVGEYELLLLLAHQHPDLTLIKKN
ncbi:helix-turn-helix domain-containing protein [Phytobacter sp. V91]|uniref:helix-turn-helix domain-containing protein n=1 Tax=Phytobacter sp. V91 TaxID=3369425 RepID=UPI003F61FE97